MSPGPDCYIASATIYPHPVGTTGGSLQVTDEDGGLFHFQVAVVF
jgi:hypothetical protein